MNTASIDNISIRERVGAYIARERVTKQSIADLLGMSLNTLNSKLDGTSRFTLDQAFTLADLMGCNVDDLRKPLSQTGIAPQPKGADEENGLNNIL